MNKFALTVLSLAAVIAVAAGSGARTRTSAPPATSVNGATISPASLDPVGFIDAGSIYVHGPITFDGTISGCRLNPSVDSNFLYFQNCNLRASTEWRMDSLTTFAGALKFTDSNTYATVVDSPTPPTVTACLGGTAAAMTWSAGTASFRFDVGTACTSESTAVIVLPATTNCWTCHCYNVAAPTHNIHQSACSTTGATMTNYAATLATVTDWVDGADIQCMCRGG